MNATTKKEPFVPRRRPDWDGWAMAILSLAFFLLYSAALVGWVRPYADVTVLLRLEPLIFLVIGYHFGRSPGRRNEETLRNEVERANRKAEAAERSKESANGEREAIEEKIRNTRVALRSELLELASESRRWRSGGGDTRSTRAESLSQRRTALETAINILNS